MNVNIVGSTDDPERVICTAARNDYLDDYAGEMAFEEVMEKINGEDIEAKKRTLIEQLLQHGHYGPFEHPQITFAIEGVSRSCMAQITRHRHASFDIQSMRYVSFDDVDPGEMKDGEMVVMPPATTDMHWVGRNQQGGTVDEQTAMDRRNTFQRSIRESIRSYQELLELGMAPEDARFVLPIGTKVNIIMSVNPRMLMHIADMRAAGDAQWEIRRMTEEILELGEEWCPLTFDYYDRRMRNRKNRLAP